MGTATATVSIDAPLAVVWSIMLDLDGYELWNPFILRVSSPPGRPARVGDNLTLHVRFGGGRRYDSPERITTITPPHPDGAGEGALLAYEFRGWLHGLYLIRGRRTQVVRQLPGQSTVYTTTERFRGALTRVVPTRAVQSGFRRHAQALKKRAEELATQGGAGPA